MDKEKIDRLIYELNELSEFEEQNLERMKEIAHILCDFYMPNRNKGNNAKDVEKKSAEDDQENIV